MNINEINVTPEMREVAADLTAQLETINRTMARATELGVRVDINPTVTDNGGKKLRQLTMNCVVVLSTTMPETGHPSQSAKRPVAKHLPTTRGRSKSIDNEPAERLGFCQGCQTNEVMLYRVAAGRYRCVTCSQNPDNRP